MKSREERVAFAESIADYVHTHRDFRRMSQHDAAVEAVTVLTEDIGAAQGFLDTIGVDHDLYESDDIGVISSISTTFEVSMDLNFVDSQQFVRMIQIVYGVKPEIKYGEHKWGGFA